MADSEALRARRYRAHQAGIHELCSPDRCKEAGTPEKPSEATDRLLQAVREEFGTSDPVSLNLAERLVELGNGKGPAAVQALRALAELVTAQRDDL
jgi:hypothetical protein